MKYEEFNHEPTRTTNRRERKNPHAENAEDTIEYK